MQFLKRPLEAKVKTKQFPIDSDVRKSNRAPKMNVQPLFTFIALFLCVCQVWFDLSRSITFSGTLVEEGGANSGHCPHYAKALFLNPVDNDWWVYVNGLYDCMF